MCDTSKMKSKGLCRGKNKLRTVTTTKWELPIPGSKPYWDKISDELEQRKEHVSYSSHPPSPSPYTITDPNMMLNSDESTLSKLKYIGEPIVKISPPTPMRVMPQNQGSTIPTILDDLTINENGIVSENDNDIFLNSRLSDNFSPVKPGEGKDANLYEISVCMTEFLKNSSVQTKKSCQLHKNAPPLKIFDDNLERFLPKKKATTKLAGTRVRSVFSSDVLDFSKIHSNKSCPLRSQQISKDRVQFGVSLSENKNQNLHSLSRSVADSPDKKKVKGNFGQFLKVPESPYLNLRSNSQREKKSKSKILKSNLNYMLNIPKLNDVSGDKNLFKFSDDTISDEAITGNLENYVISNLDSRHRFQAIANKCIAELNFSRSRELSTSKLETVNLHDTGSNDKLQEFSITENVVPSLTENLKPESGQSMTLPRLAGDLSIASDSSNYSNEQSVSESKISTAKHRDEPKKDFLKVPKLGAISTYPSFSKLTSGDSEELEESQKPVIHMITGINDSQNLECPVQQAESCKRDFLKVPKLSMMSSYPSFNSLIPESLDSDDNLTSPSEEISKRLGNDTPSKTSVSNNFKSTQDTSLSDEKTAHYNESSDLITISNKEVSPSINSTQNERPRRRQSLKESVRYAYRALKFLTPNKNLDFQPQSYHPPEKSASSSDSSDSSRTSKYSKFEPAIKLLTYEDVNKEWPAIRSDSSSTYGTVRSRLKQSASQYLGPDYVYLSSKTRPATSSTTIQSLTRSTSGPTLDFQEPIFKRPSEKVLKKLPKMSIFPRRKYDKCFACLHRAFEEPVKPRRELPLATWNAVMKESFESFSESESSSITLPDVEDIVESQSDYEDNWTEVLRGTRKSSFLDKSEWKSSKGAFRTNIVDLYKSRQPFVRAPEESQALKGDVNKLENLRRNLSSKDSITTNTHPKPLSLSSEHSKPSSLSGHSSESEEPQVQIKPAVPASECFVSPYAPLHWVPSLDPLKSLKFRKPVSMHGRAVSITKTEDDSTSDDNANDYRSTRKDKKFNNASARKFDDKNQENGNVDSSSKSAMKFGEKSPGLPKQPSIIAKIITSQLSTVASLAKKQSKVDLLSNDSKTEIQAMSHQQLTKMGSEVDGDVPKETLIKSQTGDGNQMSNLKTHPESDDDSIDKKESVGKISETVRSIARSLTKSTMPEITEQPIENGSMMDTENKENIVADESKEQLLPSNDKLTVSRDEMSEEQQEHAVELQDDDKEKCKIYSNDIVIQILEECIQENRTPFEMLEALSAVATRNNPFTSKETITKPEIKRAAKTAKNLIKLLIDSKKYLNPDTFSPHLEFSSPQTPLCNPRQLRRVLPTKTYNLVARILGMPENHVDKPLDKRLDFQSGHQAKDPFKLRQTGKRGLAADSSDMIVHPPSARGRRKPIIDEDDFEYPQQSPYALFMNKPKRKAINWRPLTEHDTLGYDPEATLNMRATRVTNKICEDFCQWLRGLGGGHSEDIDEEVLRDMFQIEFTAEACRAMQVLIKEIPMVPITVALARNSPGAGELALTRRYLIKDAQAERMPKKTIGFGTMLPRGHRFIPPKNRVNERWLQCENVPRDLETMEAVWKGITHLDSVKGFLAWVKAHPGVKPPKILTEAYAKKGTLQKQPSAEETGGHIELEMDQIESLKVGDVE